MSGHHPPSWNHHPMQVPQYMPRLPMAHSQMSNERPLGNSWHNNSGGMPTGPPQLPQHPGGGHFMNPEHNQYPYHGPNIRKHPHMDMSHMSTAQFVGRHPILAPNNEYDSSMMDLSVSKSNNQCSNAATRIVGDQVLLQDYSHKMNHKQAPCDEPMLPTSHENLTDGYSNDIDVLNRRQNPIGLPPLADAMELVKEALLSKVKVPTISDLGNDFNQEHLPVPLNHKPPEVGEGVDLSVVGKPTEVENNSVGKECRRKGRKPNKTSKVVNDVAVNESPETATKVAEGEVDLNTKHPTEASHELGKIDDQHRTDIPLGGGQPEDRSPSKRSAPSDCVANGSTIDAEDGVLSKRNRRSVDTPLEGSPQKEVAPLNSISNGEESRNGRCQKEGEKDPDTSFEEVENKLSEMFAGIGDGDTKSREIEPQAITKTTPGRRKSVCLSLLIGEDLDSDDDEDFSPEEMQKKPSKGKKKAVTKKPCPKSNGANNGGSGGGSKSKAGSKVGGSAATAKKKKKNKKKGGGGNKWDDDVVPISSKKPPKETEEGRYRGPLLQVRKDGSLNVLNGPQGQTEDDPDSRNGVKVKKFLHNGAERNKVIRGLHTNTLSVKYDTDRTDTTWICVFCKLGPHKMGLGDLFGPYMVTTDCDEFRLMETQSVDVFQSNRTRLDMVQTAPHRLPAVPAAGSIAPGLKSPASKQPGKRGPKKKNPPSTDSAPAEDLYIGLTKATDTTFEIWAHEDCLVWGSGIHMIAGRLVGIEDAVWGSIRTPCTLCMKTGAVVCCLQRGCSDRVHLPCGRQSNWILDEDALNSYCQSHGTTEGKGTSVEPVVAGPSGNR